MYYVTHENVLDWIESFGREMQIMTHPSSHPYDDAERAKPYVPMYEACRKAWFAVKNGDDPLKVVKWLMKSVKGIPSNHASLFEKALLGRFEKNEAFFRAGSEKFANHDWVTYKGDFYSVDFGNYLNIPRVHRIANEHLPEERCKLDGAKEIAGMMPNPCTRVSVQIQVS